MTNQGSPEKKRKNLRFILLFSALVIAGGIYGTVKYLHSLKHEETDDAQIEANISSVRPRVSGYIASVRVKDNQFVSQGDTLVVIDGRDFQLALAQAEAALAAAKSEAQGARAGIPLTKANVVTARANVATVAAQIEAAKVQVWRTTQDLKRYENLIQDHSITQQQYEQAVAAKQRAERQLEVLEAQKAGAAKQTAAIASQTPVSSARVAAAKANILKAQAAVDAARLNLSYTVITAAVSGQVAAVNLQPGQFLQAGQALFDIIPNETKWVVANFKETQLTKMRVGQPVTITVDAYPDHELHGQVASFSPFTGAKASLLPADNASGNFVKVVQRIPVKIIFSDTSNSLLDRLRAGMNVFVDVHVK